MIYRFSLCVIAIAVASIASGDRVFAQSGTRGSGTRTTRGPQMTADQFAASFWNYLVKSPSKYRNWGTYPGQADGVYAGQSPHGAHLRLYANSIARKNPKNAPAGSVIVKENYGEDKTTLMAITVMYRARGFDPKHGDWYYIKYNPDGTVAKTPVDKGSKPIYGRFQSCINCHEGADGGDYLFAND